MPAPVFQPRDEARPSELFDRILERIQRDLPDAMGLAVTIHSSSAETTVVAASGVGRECAEAQLAGLGGPVVDAVEHQVPVLSPDLWSDDRWPALTLDALRARVPGYAGDPATIRGTAAMPGVWQTEGTVVLSCALRTRASAATVTTLIGYERLITAALVTAAAEDGSQIADMLAVLQSRGAIEQAKGVIMGRLRCDAETAWATLRRASHDSNVKLRMLAVALIEHIGEAPAEQPSIAAPIVPDERARTAARLLWAVLSHAPETASDDG